MVSVIIPTYNAETYLPTLLESLRSQTVKYELIIIDSGSTDNTRAILNKENISFTSIPKQEFNHGGTRNLGVELASYENVVMLTQDALPANNCTLQNLLDSLTQNLSVGMAYGRQLPYPDATLLSVYARLTNYPAKSDLKSIADIPRLGIKTCHCSNSFAVYRKSLLTAVGGFPVDTVLGEDVVVGALLIKAGLSIAYCAEAQVVHSHNYSISEEFRRYFDIGAFHQQQRDLLREFTSAESEGFRYVVAEWSYLLKNRALKLIPSQLLRTVVKYAGYKLGRFQNHIPLRLKRRISMHADFWK